MALLEYPLRFVQSVHPAFFVAVVPAVAILVHFIRWLVDPHGLRSFPGPWIARFSDLWLGRVAQQGHRSEVVHRMHEKYGEHDQHVPSPPNPVQHLPLRVIRPHRPKPPLHFRSRSAPNRLRARQWLVEVKLLRRFRFHHAWPVQHPGPRRAHAQAQDRLPHILSEKRPGIRALRQRLRAFADTTVGSALRWRCQGQEWRRRRRWMEGP